MERKYFTGSMPLLTPNNPFKTCGVDEAFTSTTIFGKCGRGETSSGGHQCYIVKVHYVEVNLTSPHLGYCLIFHIRHPLSRTNVYILVTPYSSQGMNFLSASG